MKTEREKELNEAASLATDSKKRYAHTIEESMKEESSAKIAKEKEKRSEEMQAVLQRQHAEFVQVVLILIASCICHA